jgi:hypothetical protein
LKAKNKGKIRRERKSEKGIKIEGIVGFLVSPLSN